MLAVPAECAVAHGAGTHTPRRSFCRMLVDGFRAKIEAGGYGSLLSQDDSLVLGRHLVLENSNGNHAFSIRYPEPAAVGAAFHAAGVGHPAACALRARVPCLRR